MGRRVDLARLLETARLERVVPRLRAETLHQLIQYRGLESSGEVIAAATPEQISSVLEVDLWRRVGAGGDERFDPGRFGEWLGALVEMGDEVAARVVSAIDERLVTAGLSGHVKVFDPAARDAPLTPGNLATEVGGYLVSARRTDAWDAIVSLLLALDAAHHPFFESVMRGCRALSNSVPEADGLHELLSAPGQLLHDLASVREARRSGQGYLSPADARLVLDLARKPFGDPTDAASIRRVFADYALHGAGQQGEVGAALPGRPDAVGKAPEAPAAGTDAPIEALIRLLAEEGLVPERPRALLPGTVGEASRLERMRELMARVRDAGDEAYEARSRELAFLANALVAGCSIHARPFAPQEASDAVVATCNLGLEEWGSLHAGFLVGHDLLSVFHRGWRALHEMSLSAADRLIAILGVLRCADLETQAGLHVLRQQLAKHRAAGAPWRARDALDVIAVLDLPAWVSLLGVLDECPIVPAALTATLERRTGSISATAFEFVSTRRQVGDVRAFMAKLPDILRR
ncbi:MAG: hypothetical protein KBA95_02525 [Acidobacteria bacterium]|nr:hypothetical protein [Acidobacteriota bacterium]